MGNEIIHGSTVDAIKGAVEVGGPKEMSALTKELNSLSQNELRTLGQALPCINAMEAKAHPGLPELYLAGAGGGSGDGKVTSTEYMLQKANADGSSTELYHREFGTDHGKTTDTKFDAFTHQPASIETTKPNGLHTLTLVDAKDGK